MLNKITKHFPLIWSNNFYSSIHIFLSFLDNETRSEDAPSQKLTAIYFWLNEHTSKRIFQTENPLKSSQLFYTFSDNLY